MAPANQRNGSNHAYHSNRSILFAQLSRGVCAVSCLQRNVVAVEALMAARFRIELAQTVSFFSPKQKAYRIVTPVTDAGDPFQSKWAALTDISSI